MKLKNVLISAFLILTLIPIIIVLVLLYQSGLNLSKESYTRNLIESINVQVDYISQAIENNMISDYRFANNNIGQYMELEDSKEEQRNEIFTAFQTYLESAEDKITVSVLMDKDSEPLYTIGEKVALDTIYEQLTEKVNLTKQMICEFDLGDETYSLGIITPIFNSDNTYIGSLVSVYDKSYIFKIISSYYKIADTSIYICRDDGSVINFKAIKEDTDNAAMELVLDDMYFESEGDIDTNVDNNKVSGYYKNIHNTPWYLVGFLDNKLMYSFTNQFVLIYIVIIIGVVIADIILSIYFSHKVVEPINRLIKVMEGYQNSLNSKDLEYHEKSGYFETKYLRTKFLSLMNTVLLVQHNFEGIYHLYQSSTMDDTNIDIDVKNQTISSNKESFERLISSLGVSDQECIVENFIKCFCEKDQRVLMDMFENMRDEHLSVTCEAEVYTPHFNEKWFHVLVVPMYEEERLSRLFVQLRDISSFKKQEFESSERARKDSLTRLLNRSGFEESVNKILQSEEKSGIHGLLFIDMNYFKLVNDNLGHSAGDDLLYCIGKTLKNTVGPNDIASRMGGDEFAVFLPFSTKEAIEAMQITISKKIVFPFQTKKTSFVVSASIGISMWEHDNHQTLEQVMQEADADMYRIKREFKKNTV